MVNKIVVKIEYGKLSNVMAWCRENCIGAWSIVDTDAKSDGIKSSLEAWVDTEPTSYTYEFDFEKDIDASAFSMNFL